MTAGWETKDGRADMTNFEMDLFDTRCNNAMEKDDSEECCKHSFIKPACLPISILAILLLMTFFIPLFNEDSSESTKKYERSGECLDDCSLEIVETIPVGMTFEKGPKHKSTFEAWDKLIRNAKTSIDITAYYWNLIDNKNYKTSKEGRSIYDNLNQTAQHDVKIRIAQNTQSEYFPQRDSKALETFAEIRTLDFPRLIGMGILHSKFWIVDQKHVYIGSANMDWKSLTEVKEIGVLIRNCPCIATEFNKIFSIYWRLGENEAVIPYQWPISFRTKFNSKNPLEIKYNGVPHKSFISNSPVQFNPKGREHDLHAIVALMEKAKEYIKISVMDYLPVTEFMGKDNQSIIAFITSKFRDLTPQNKALSSEESLEIFITKIEYEGKKSYWPPLDNAIRAAAFRGVNVQLLVSRWEHTKSTTWSYLKSLLQINDALTHFPANITIKFFTVPPNKEVPFSRVNHNKFMVTEKAAYIGTSNWIGDYFITSAGVGFVVEKAENGGSLVEEFNKIFNRDWDSRYAHLVNL